MDEKGEIAAALGDSCGVACNVIGIEPVPAGDVILGEFIGFGPDYLYLVSQKVILKA
jgi:hypothetical protein